MGWSKNYKEYINCNNPKGFSQRAHCQGQNKKMTEEKKDHEYSMARSELSTIRNAVKRLSKKMGKRGEGELKAWVQSKITKASDYIDTAADYVTNEETISEKRDGKSAKDPNYSLKDWFNDEWVQTGGKYDGKPCAKQPGQTTKPFCRDPDDRAAMSKDEREKRAKKKREKDPNPNKKGKAKMVSASHQLEGEYIEEKAKKKDACYNKVKSRYSIWPSAYASGALVRCRKVGADNWGNKSESYEFSNWRDDFKATEYEFFDIVKAEPLIAEGHPMYDPDRMKASTGNQITHTSADVRKAEKKEKIHRLTQQGSTDGERRAAASKAGISLPPIQKNHVELKGEQLDEAGKKCWKGYKKKGTQKLFGKTYNRCVKEEVEIASGDIKKLVKKAIMRIDANVDGIIDTKDPKEKNMGVFIPSPDGKKKIKPIVRFEGFSDWRSELKESKIDKSKMKCNKPKAQAHGSGETGKSHVVKACSGGEEKIIRFGQRGVKGSPKKEGESKAYASRRKRFKSRHAKNIAKGKMSAAYWSNVTKW